MRRNKHYDDRVNRVLNHIGGHLDGDLSLNTLSEIGCFSPFHFHRIFQGITGETLNSHVRRVRLERAALLMRTSPERRITDIALDTGFAGTAEFSRAFKNQFGRTASSWDRRSALEKSKICKEPGMQMFHTVEELQSWKAAARDARVRVQRVGAFRFVYERIYAPYGSTRLMDAYQAMLAWLRERGTDVRDVVFTGMSLDDPSVTPAEKCRYDLGIAFLLERGGVLGAVVKERGRRALPVAKDAMPGKAECEAHGWSLRDFDAQRVVAFHCAGTIGDVSCAWQYLYRLWLPSSVYEPANAPAMEMFVQLPEEIGWENFNLELCIPVARL